MGVGECLRRVLYGVRRHLIRLCHEGALLLLCAFGHFGVLYRRCCGGECAEVPLAVCYEDVEVQCQRVSGQRVRLRGYAEAYVVCLAGQHYVVEAYAEGWGEGGAAVDNGGDILVVPHSPCLVAVYGLHGAL